MVNVKRFMSLLFLVCSFIYLNVDINAESKAPIIDEIHKIENADKYIYGHVSVFETDSYRDAKESEVYVTIREYDKDDNVIKDYTGYTRENYSIYGEAKKSGIFVVSLDDSYANSDHKFEVISAYRIDGDLKYYSSADDIKVDKVTVSDVTPPNPAVITSKVYANSKSIKGLSDSPGAKLSLSVNNKSVVIPETFVSADGAWELVIPDSLVLKTLDIINVFLEDESGNKNPIISKEYHNTIFYGAASTRVLETNPVLKASKEVKNLTDLSGKYNVGDTIEYTIKFKISEGKAYVVSLNDILPNGVEYLNHTTKINDALNFDKVYKKDNGITGIFPNLEENDEVEVVINAIITSEALNKSIENKVAFIGQNSYGEKVITGEYSDGNKQIIGEQDLDAKLTINKRVENVNKKPYYMVGDIVKYEIDIEAENASVNNLVFNDVITSDLIVESSSISKISGFSNQSSGNSIKYSINKLEKDEKITIIITAKISDSSVGKVINNQASIKGYSDKNALYNINSEVVSFKVLNVTIQIIMEDTNVNKVAEADEEIKVTIKINNNENIDVDNILVINDINLLMDYVSDNLDEIAVSVIDNSKINKEIKLSELKVGYNHDLRRKESLTFVYQVKMKTDLDIYEYATLINKAQLNAHEVEAKMNTGKMRIISGMIFEDSNYNHRNDDKRLMTNVDILLVDGNKKTIAQSQSDLSGKYSIKVLDQPAKTTAYQLKIEEIPGYLISDVKGSIINYNTLLSRKIDLRSDKLDDFNIGYAKDITTSVISTDQIVDYGDSVVSNINYSNGKIDKISKSNNNITYSLKNNVLRINAVKIGDSKINITFKDNYSRNKITKTINVKVNKYNISTQDQVISNLISKGLSKDQSGNYLNNTLPQSGLEINGVLVMMLIGVLSIVLKRRKFN